MFLFHFQNHIPATRDSMGERVKISSGLRK